MKVTIINKSFQTGGAAIASKRLWRALKKQSINAHFLVFDAFNLNYSTFNAITKSKLQNIKWWYLFIKERLFFYFFERDKSIRFNFSPAVAGINLAKNRLIKNTDIIHLNWINQGFLSIKSIKNLIKTGKPIIVTLHDMWYFTGGCHLPLDCQNYKEKCGNCFYLKNPSSNDISNKGYLKKEKLYAGNNITFVACSKWMQRNAKSSGLLKSKNVVTIPNAFDTNIFCPASKREMRDILDLPNDKILILFGAANATNKNKGFEYLVQGINNLILKYPRHIANIELVILGKSNADISKLFSLPVTYLGNVSSELKMSQIYQSADMFVLPTLMDNLPNMVIESMSCETPVVSFNVGGVPEIIDHLENGYVASYKSSEDLANGIKWILENNKDNILGKAAREKVLREFSEEVVAQKYIDLYQTILNDKQS